MEHRSRSGEEILLVARSLDALLGRMADVLNGLDPSASSSDADFADVAIRAIEEVGAEIPTYNDLSERFELAFNSHFASRPSGTTQSRSYAQSMRDALTKRRDSAVRLTVLCKEQAEGLATASQQTPNPHAIRVAEAYARLHEGVRDATGEYTLRLRRMIGFLDDKYGTSASGDS